MYIHNTIQFLFHFLHILTHTILNKRYRIPKWQSKMDNILAILFRTILWLSCSVQSCDYPVQYNLVAILFRTILWLSRSGQSFGYPVQYNLLAILFRTIFWLSCSVQSCGYPVQNNLVAILFSTILWLFCSGQLSVHASKTFILFSFPVF